MSKTINLQSTVYDNGKSIIEGNLNEKHTDILALQSQYAALAASLSEEVGTLTSALSDANDLITALSGRVTSLETVGGILTATMTLTGTKGTATIGGAGSLTKTIRFDSDLSTTASTFVTNNAADYLATNIILTSDGADLVFTSKYAGTEFTTPTITTITSDMGGSNANTQANGTGTAQVDTITLSGTDGKVSIESAGGLTRVAEFDTDLTTTTGAFVTNYAADYAAEGITVTSSVADLIFTATDPGVAFTSPTKSQIVGDLDGSVVNTQANISDTAQVDTITLSGTTGGAIISGPGSLVNSVVFASGGTADLTQTASDFVTNQAADYVSEGVTVTSSGADIIFTASTAGTPFDSPTIANDYGDLDGSVVNTQVNLVDTAQVDTVTITGTDGKATIDAAGGLTKVFRFSTDLATTAANFVTDYAADYSAQAITITSSGADIIFTADVAGTGFTNPTISNTAWDLDASIVNTQVNVAKVKQIDTLTLTGTAGQFTVESTGSLTKLGEFDTGLTETAAAFVVDHAAAYLAEDVVLTSSTADLIFTANVAGTGFTSPTINDVVADLDGTVVSAVV